MLKMTQQKPKRRRHTMLMDGEHQHQFSQADLEVQHNS